MLVLLTL